MRRLLKAFPNLQVPVINGDFKLVYEPDPSAPNSWMLNDHCLLQDDEGLIHFFGIENPLPTTAEVLKAGEVKIEPSDTPHVMTIKDMLHKYLYHRPGSHCRVGHAIARNIWGPWTRLPAAADGGEQRRHYGSPFVIPHEGAYWMFVPVDKQSTGILKSHDLSTWSEVTDATPWFDTQVFGPAGHRDPCIIRLDDGTFLQYFAAADARQRHTIGLARSADLRHWVNQEPCYVEDLPGAPSHFGIFESPFVLRRGSLFYLFIGFSHRRYYETIVVVSDNPFHFPAENKLTTLFSHAPELIEINGETYMSSCGMEDPQTLNRFGLWMSKLVWLTP